MTGPFVEDAQIIASDALGAYRVVTLRAPQIAASIGPGRFIEIATAPCLLRRPFSVYRADPAEGTVAVAFSAIGEGTAWLAVAARGTAVSVVGPLGTGFTVPNDPGVDLIVGGGYGAAALAFLAEQLADAGSTVHAVLGGRNAERVFADELIDECCASVAIMTDDGSRGSPGIVTDPIAKLVERFAPRRIYACGPMAMLEAVGTQGEALGVPTQLAVEEFMACGIGVCWTCVVPARVNGEIRHLRSCTEGPVFAGEVLVWA
jgi:dihydroorotate dehydrogenase electron transfer subunit